MKIFYANCDKKNSHDFLFEILETHYDVIANESDLEKTEYGKLSLKNSPVRFNITHSGDIVAVGISEKELGLDVEFIKPRNNAKLAQKIFGTTPKNDEEFYTLWTKAESFVKYSATALLPELKKIEIIGDEIIYDGVKQPVQTKTVKVGNYIFSIASDDLDIEFIDLGEYVK